MENHIDVGNLMDTVNTLFGWNLQLKPYQFDVIQAVLAKRHTMAVLPTGYGKSLTYMLPPLMLDIVRYFNSLILTVSFPIDA